MSKRQQARELYQQLKDEASRKEITKIFNTRLGISRTTANTYYQTFKGEDSVPKSISHIDWKQIPQKTEKELIHKGVVLTFTDGKGNFTNNGARQGDRQNQMHQDILGCIKQYTTDKEFSHATIEWKLTNDGYRHERGFDIDVALFTNLADTHPNTVILAKHTIVDINRNKSNYINTYMGEIDRVLLSPDYIDITSGELLKQPPNILFIQFLPRINANYDKKANFIHLHQTDVGDTNALNTVIKFKVKAYGMKVNVSIIHIFYDIEGCEQPLVDSKIQSGSRDYEGHAPFNTRQEFWNHFTSCESPIKNIDTDPLKRFCEETFGQKVTVGETNEGHITSTDQLISF